MSHYTHPDPSVRALIAKAQADERERIAQAIEAHAEATLPTWLQDNYLTAARIARKGAAR